MLSNDINSETVEGFTSYYGHPSHIYNTVWAVQGPVEKVTARLSRTEGAHVLLQLKLLMTKKKVFLTAMCLVYCIHLQAS